jgi:hypothetical protein
MIMHEKCSIRTAYAQIAFWAVAALCSGRDSAKFQTGFVHLREPGKIKKPARQVENSIALMAAGCLGNAVASALQSLYPGYAPVI